MAVLLKSSCQQHNLMMDRLVVESIQLLLVEVENVQPAPVGINPLLVEQMVKKLHLETYR